MMNENMSVPSPRIYVDPELYSHVCGSVNSGKQKVDVVIEHLLQLGMADSMKDAKELIRLLCLDSDSPIKLRRNDDEVFLMMGEI